MIPEPGRVAIAGGAALGRCAAREAAATGSDRAVRYGPAPGTTPGQAAADIRRMIGSISALGAAAGTGKIVAV